MKDGEIEQEDPQGENLEDLDPEQLAYLQQFQRVYVEDLGEELLMDPQGNLYDLNGNIIGQAASDDEGEESADAEDGVRGYDMPPNMGMGMPKGKGRGQQMNIPPVEPNRPRRSASP